MNEDADNCSGEDEVQTAKNFHLLWNWFHFVGLYGREPTEEEQADDSLLFV
jgi:hypothetical protein